MEKRKYVSPQINVVGVDTEALLAAVSGGFGEEVGSGDNASKNHMFRSNLFHMKGLFDEEQEDLEEENQ